MKYHFHYTGAYQI